MKPFNTNHSRYWLCLQQAVIVPCDGNKFTFFISHMMTFSLAMRSEHVSVLVSIININMDVLTVKMCKETVSLQCVDSLYVLVSILKCVSLILYLFLLYVYGKWAAFI